MSGFSKIAELTKPVEEIERRILDLMKAKGFVVAGRADLQPHLASSSHMTFGSYLSYQVYVPRIYHEVVQALPDAILVPCSISIYKHIDGNARVSIVNTTGVILVGIQNDTIRDAMDELNGLLGSILSGISAPSNFIPDIDTSVA